MTNNPALELLGSLHRGLGISVPGLASTWLYFSHPQRDEHFRSKLGLTVLALAIATVCNVSYVIDLLSYYREWRNKGFHIIVMVRPNVPHARSTVAVATCASRCAAHVGDPSRNRFGDRPEQAHVTRAISTEPY